MDGLRNTDNNYVSSCDDDVIGAIQHNVFSCVNNVFTLSSKHVNAIKQMSGKDSGIKYCLGEDVKNNHLDNNNMMNNSTGVTSNLKEIKPNNNNNNVHKDTALGKSPSHNQQNGHIKAQMNGGLAGKDSTQTAPGKKNNRLKTLPPQAPGEEIPNS